MHNHIIKLDSDIFKMYFSITTRTTVSFQDLSIAFRTMLAGPVSTFGLFFTSFKKILFFSTFSVSDSEIDWVVVKAKKERNGQFFGQFVLLPLGGKEVIKNKILLLAIQKGKG